MKIVLTVFAPFLVAIAIRLALVVIGIVMLFVFGGDMDFLIEFDTFDFDESWAYWILVVFGSFFAEVAIWDEN